MATTTTIVWFQRDLRVEDNPALSFAAERGAVIPVYIWSPEEEKPWSPGAASKWWLHHALLSLQDELKRLKLELLVLKGDSLTILKGLIHKTGAEAVAWNRCYEPSLIKRDSALIKKLGKEKIAVSIFNGSLLHSPSEVFNKQGKPFQIFTPFWNACLKEEEPRRPSARLTKAHSCNKKLHSETVDSLDLLPKIHWDRKFNKRWDPSISGAHAQLSKFQKRAGKYPLLRDRPDLEGISNLSAYLHFGQLSPQTVWHAVKEESFRRQLYWREFAHYLLYHFPETPEKPLHKKFNSFPWTQNPKALKAWQHGLTGYPIIDAGMRELWNDGWMHNRVRMLVGSFLVKDLRIHWQEGARWFWDTLVDADLANNTLGWQWVSGCGADAAPYFRIFNPVTQGEKFDPEGDYVRKWIPELSKLPTEWIHKPWEAPSEVLTEAEVFLGKNYPKPIVDHAAARLESLKIYKRLVSKSTLKGSRRS